MKPFVSVLVSFFKMFASAIMIVIGTFGLYINMHDYTLLILNLAFLAFSIYLFLRPLPIDELKKTSDKPVLLRKR
ncbi:hypothetical protein [Beggiatoa leptomitoformis]|uniref:Uncharacterized protein n=1 Tax=Beggiatoa leptomitoformis TaxID=288004 RepID=A0A2N9YFL9_9GAMM|nr:hypothetical protein [Beggiatoa leptomitoformis]ALG68389.1 hypothetical protein AL038_12620 [Beggiatoa leptomitoformis]AUI69284.1 hypothetical protein BLE401_11645 [Beggiatoa leptomitoformis]